MLQRFYLRENIFITLFCTYLRAIEWKDENSLTLLTIFLICQQCWYDDIIKPEINIVVVNIGRICVLEDCLEANSEFANLIPFSCLCVLGRESHGRN